MSSDAECPHGYYHPASCLDCMEDSGLGAAPVRRPTPEGATFSANCDGQCAGIGACNSQIRIGERITRMSDGTYRHVGCI